MGTEENAGWHRRDPDADAALAAALRGADEAAARDALEQLFRRLATALIRFARHVGAADQADDVVTDVFATLWVRRESLDPAFRPEPYLYRAVRNRTLQYLRGESRARHRDAVVVELAQLDHDEDDDRGVELERGAVDTVASIVWRAVDELPESQRTALTLRLSHSLPLATVAATMELSIPAVKMLLQRAFKTLRAQLAPLLDSIDD
jgi:RNA polymerase sigma factor (sigma-70 family)